MSGALSPLLGMVKPLARNHATPENMDTLFTALTAQYPAADGEKNVLLVNRTADGRVMGGVWSVEPATGRLTACHTQQPLDQLLLALLEKI